MRTKDHRLLAEMIRAIEQRHALNKTANQSMAPRHDGISLCSSTVSTGWPPVDHNWGGLDRAILHEWFGIAPAEGIDDRPRRRIPLPRCILAHLAWQAIDTSHGAVIWVGKASWPHARLLIRDLGQDRRLLQHSVWVDPADDAGRLWAIDLALRCSAVTAVIGDGSRFSIAATRRLQLAAKTSRALSLLARPVTDLSQRSVAATRWLVQASPSNGSGPRWHIHLLRCKCQRHFLPKTKLSLGNRGHNNGPRLPSNKNNFPVFPVQWNGVQGTAVVSDSLPKEQ